MLISHKKKFIFTKTAKTAGTSVESYYEPFCMPEGEWQELHRRSEYVSETGIIGYRGKDASGCKYYNHMPATEIRDLIGKERWDSYFKFTVVRNPFTKLVSGWYHFRRPNVGVFSICKSIIRDPAYLPSLLFKKKDIAEFRAWVRSGGRIIDRDKYLIDGQVAVDCFIKQEELAEGIQHVNAVLGISNYNREIPTFKSGMRDKSIPIRDFYDSKTEKLVRESYAWEFERFGYEMPTD
jgi:hypothetical protein